MNYLNPILVLVVAFVSVFLEAWVDIFRELLGTQLTLLPALIVYVSLTHSMIVTGVLAVCGGLWFDSLSCNPLGITILPLFLVGFFIQTYRELLLRDNLFAQSVLGLSACVLCPLGTLFLLLNFGNTPRLGWESIWQFVVMGVGGAVLTPLFFILFDYIDNTFNYQPVSQSSFRADREIKYNHR